MNKVATNPILTRSARRRGLTYRYPTENWLLAATLLIIGLAVLLFSVTPLYGVAIVFVGGTMVNYLFIRIILQGYKRAAVEVTPEQFPELHALYQECRRYIDVPDDTKLFVTYSPYMNAFAMGLGRPYMIVLFSGLVENMDREELKYVLAHEMGHIQFGHTVWLTLIGQLGRETYGLPFFSFLFYTCFLFWSRAAEMSADRAGLVACGRLAKTISAQMKFGAGPLLARWADPEALARQAREAKLSFLGSLIEGFGTHPLLTTRLRRLVEFAASDTYRHLRPDAAAEGASPASSPSSTGRDRPPLRRLKPAADTASASPPPTLTERTAPTASMFAAGDEPAETSPPSPESDSPRPPAPGEPAWQRLNLATARANIEQADLWLKMAELLEAYQQPEQAAACLNRAQTLTLGLGGPGAAGSWPALPGGGLADDALALPAPAGQRGCPQCSTPNPDGARYCYRCRAVLQRACLQCGVWLEADHANCTACGQNQAQAIAQLKEEAETTRQTARESLPPRGLAWWEILYGLIFLVDVGLVAAAVIDWPRASSSDEWLLYVGGGAALVLISIVGGVLWHRRRVRRYWQAFDRVEAAVRRYNEIAEALAQQNIHLEPARLTPKDPWSWM